ncbi:MAG: hypothetical protein KAG66_02675, partial [Methylococcales bacterium]|nr:hypothetical protein [Methylococcales bacterium]
INSLRGVKGTKVWLRGYWDRIVRDEDELTRVRQYIINNPFRWAENRSDLDTVLSKMVFHRA